MLNQTFYWGTIRKSIVAFGNMFNDIYIERRNSSGSTIQTIKVPLSYAPKQKFIQRIVQQPVLEENKIQVVLPRMSFEMTGIYHDPNRKISPITQNRNINTTTTTVNGQYAPSPYNINVSLYVYSKNQDDGLQIIEQILPYFNPDYNLTLKAVPLLDIKNDLPILLENISYEDQYEGDFASRRSIIWTLNFIMKLNFYGPVSKQGIIRKATAKTYNDKALSDRQQTYTVEVSPNTAKPGDDIDFIETFEDF